MRIKLIKPVVVDQRHIAVGDVAEVEETVGKFLIRRGMAVEVQEDAEPEVKREPKRPRRKRS